jgi:outer membrane protein TolC
MALEQGYDARIARLESARAADEHARVREVFLPKLWLTSQAGYSNRLDEKLRVLDHQARPRDYPLATLGATEGWLNVFVDQVLLDLRRWRDVERAELAAALARAREDERREAIAREVAGLFVGVLRLEALLAAGRAQEGSARWLDEQAHLLHGAGRALGSEREAAALHLEGLRLENEALGGELEDARRALWLAVSGAEGEVPEAAGAAHPSAPLALDEASLPAPEAPGAVEELEQAVAGAPGVRALEIAQALEEKGAASARAGRLPTVGLRGGYSHYGIRRYDDFDDELRVGVDVRVPLFDGFESRSAEAGARRSAEIARLARESLLADKRARVRELVRRLASSGTRSDLAQRVAATAQEQSRVADLGLSAGRGSLDSALAARERANRARARAIDARFDRLELWAELERELGRLADALGAPPAGAP